MQALLLYKLSNKNHLKNINEQNFAHFMRGITTKAFTVNKLFCNLSYIFYLKNPKIIMKNACLARLYNHLCIL